MAESGTRKRFEEGGARGWLHLIGYVGAPLVRDAMLVATKVFEEIGAETLMTLLLYPARHENSCDPMAVPSSF